LILIHNMQGPIVLLVLLVLFAFIFYEEATLLIHELYMIHVQNSMVLRIAILVVQDYVRWPPPCVMFFSPLR
jgi:hypothetical protein